MEVCIHTRYGGWYLPFGLKDFKSSLGLGICETMWWIALLFYQFGGFNYELFLVDAWKISYKHS